MPKAFEDCVRAGGRVRTKRLKGGKYVRICFPKGGGAGIAGEVRTRKQDVVSKTARKLRAK